MKKLLVILLILCLICAGFLYYANLKTVQFLNNFNIAKQDVLQALKNNTNATKDIKILFLGVGGGQHEGPDLTDSMMLITISKDRTNINTLSIPRDIWDPNIQDKVNTYLTYAKEQEPQNVNGYVKQKFFELTQIKPDNIIVLDFAHFEKIINLLGGIDVALERAFIDTEFPIPGAENKDCVPYDAQFKCRYKTIAFAAGTNHLSGERALEFVRSRHSQDLESGTDFARANRQHLVISAIINKLTVFAKQLNYQKLFDVANYLDKNITRDISNKDLLNLAIQMGKKYKQIKFSQKTISEDLLKVGDYAKYDNRYVLVPAADGASVADVFAISAKL